MLKEKRQLFEWLFMVVDLFLVGLAWCVAYWIRFKTTFVPTDKGIPPISEYIELLPIIWVIWAFMFRRMGLYKPMRGVRPRREQWLLVNANIISLLVLLSVTYLFREKTVEYSRLTFVYFGAIATLFTIVQRSILRFGLQELRRKGYNIRYLLIVGEGSIARDIVARIRRHRELGVQIVGCLSLDGSRSNAPVGVPVVGSYKDIKNFLKVVEIDQLIVALPLGHSQYLPDIMNEVQDTLIDVKIVPDIYQFVNLGGAIEEFEGLPVVSIQTTPMDGLGRYLKRAVDFLIASSVVFLLSPVLLFIALLVKLTSRGPIFYRQERVSVDGSKFDILKFRSMYIDSEINGPGWTKPGDVRITPIGRIMRSTSIDELPQLFNVIRGEMSIVGPRPERPVFIEEFRRHVPRYMLRHKVPAGITGWAQVNGWRGDTSIAKRIEFDLYYIENWSLILDIKILFLTIFRGFRNRNAY